MLHALRSRSALAVIAIVVLAGGVARWLVVPDRATTANHLAALVDFSASSSANAEEPAASQPADGAARIEYRGKPGDLYYYVIENEITDDVAIITQLFKLPSSTTFKDKRTIIQTIGPAPAPATQATRPHLPPASAPAKNPDLLHCEWVVDRYEASESVTDMAEIAFDSLKHTYPPRELSGLAKVPGAKAGFDFDSKSGAPSRIITKPGSGAHPTDSRQSKTAENGLVTTENMQELLYAMGEQFLPGKPKNVGDSWEVKRVKQEAPFGTVTTNVTCRFKSLDRVGNAEIATIDLSGVIFFAPSPVKPPTPPPAPAAGMGLPAPTTRPATSMPRYPVAPRPPIPTHATTKPVPHPAPGPVLRPTSRPAVPPPPAPRPNTPPSTSKPASPTPSLGEFDPGTDASTLDFLPEGPMDSPPAAAPRSDKKTTSAPAPVALSRPVDENGAIPKPASQPVTSQPAKPTEEPFQMEGAHFSGSIKFDVTNGRLVELVIRSNSAFYKVMRTDKEEMKIKQGSKRTLRIKGSVTPPPRPIIPGGPKPPVEKPLPNARPAVQPVGATSRPGQQSTTQPAGSGLNHPMGHATTRPGSTIGATSRPIIPAKPPAILSKSIVPAVATSQPHSKPATTQPAE